MNKQLTIRQLLDQVVERMQGKEYDRKWSIEIDLQKVVREIAMENGFDPSKVVFRKDTISSRTNDFHLTGIYNHDWAWVTLRCSVKKVSSNGMFCHGYVSNRYTVKALEVFDDTAARTLADVLAKDEEFHNRAEAKKNDAKTELFEFMDEVGFERFKKFAEFYNKNSWTLDKEYQARA